MMARRIRITLILMISYMGFQNNFKLLKKTLICYCLSFKNRPMGTSNSSITQGVLMGNIESLNGQHPIDLLIEEVLKQDRIDSVKRDLNRTRIENQRNHQRNSAVSRLLRLFIDNPEKQFTPKGITEEHLRMRSGSCRARLKELFESGYIRKVWDDIHPVKHYDPDQMVWVHFFASDDLLQVEKEEEE